MVMEQLAKDISDQLRKPLKKANKLIEEAGLKGDIMVAASSSFEPLRGESYEMGAIQIISNTGGKFASAKLLEIALTAVDRERRDGYLDTDSVVAMDVAGAMELLDKLHYDVTAHLRHHYNAGSISEMVGIRKNAMGILEALDGK